MRDYSKLKERALKEYGTTPYFHQAGYMLDDGSFLNFSNGFDSDFRYVRGEDHRAISSIYENDFDTATDYMLDYMKRGNIRTIPETNSINIISKPSEAQLRKINELVRSGKINNIELSDEKGYTIDYLEDIFRPSQINEFLNKHFK